MFPKSNPNSEYHVIYFQLNSSFTNEILIKLGYWPTARVRFVSEEPQRRPGVRLCTAVESKWTPYLPSTVNCHTVLFGHITRLWQRIFVNYEDANGAPGAGCEVLKTLMYRSLLLHGVFIVDKYSLPQMFNIIYILDTLAFLNFSGTNFWSR